MKYMRIEPKAMSLSHGNIRIDAILDSKPASSNPIDWDEIWKDLGWD